MSFYCCSISREQKEKTTRFAKAKLSDYDSRICKESLFYLKRISCTGCLV